MDRDTVLRISHREVAVSIKGEEFMRKVLVLVGSAALVVALAGCSSAAAVPDKAASNATVKAPSGLITPGQLKVCIDPEYAPLEYFSDGASGDVIGFDADGARALAGYWGLKPVFQQTAFDGLMPALQANRCDVMWSGLYVSPVRLQVADAAPYLATGPELVINTKSKGSIKKAADLCGKTIAAQSGGSNAAAARKIGTDCVAQGKADVSVSEYPQTAQTILAVTNGKADALVETDVAIPGMVAKSQGHLAELDGIFPKSTRTDFGVFTKKGGTLSAPVSAAIKALIADGTLAKVADKYKLSTDKLVTS
jgi:polar amino acid transport system substrate-binding protein